MKKVLNLPQNKMSLQLLPWSQFFNHTRDTHQMVLFKNEISSYTVGWQIFKLSNTDIDWAIHYNYS